MSNERDIPKVIKSIGSVTSSQKIPRIIHQTFETCTVPVGMYEAAMTWANCNQEYEYRFSNNEDRILLIKEHFGEETLMAYNALEHGAFRADLWRYCALYVYGGVYADIDTLCKRPLSRLIKSEDEFIIPTGAASPYTVFNAFICSTSQHPFLLRAINRSVELILSQKFTNMFSVTGPIGLGISINLELDRGEKHPFEVGEHHVGDYYLRVLEKIHTEDPGSRRVIDGDEVVCFAKYDGYFQDLENTSATPWNKSQERINSL